MFLSDPVHGHKLVLSHIQLHEPRLEWQLATLRPYFHRNNDYNTCKLPDFYCIPFVPYCPNRVVHLDWGHASCPRGYVHNPPLQLARVWKCTPSYFPSCAAALDHRSASLGLYLHITRAKHVFVVSDLSGLVYGMWHVILRHQDAWKEIPKEQVCCVLAFLPHHLAHFCLAVCKLNSIHPEPVQLVRWAAKWMIKWLYNSKLAESYPTSACSNSDFPLSFLPRARTFTQSESTILNFFKVNNCSIAASALSCDQKTHGK
jgi:hypothetical protein